MNQINKVDGFVVVSKFFNIFFILSYSYFFQHHKIDEGEKRANLKSILEQNSLEEFMQLAEMSKKDFAADRYGAHEIIVNNGTVIPESMGAAGSL